MQLVPVTTNVSSNSARGEVYSIQHYVIKFVRLVTGLRFSQGTCVSFSNKTEHHDIVEILLKVV